MKCRLQNLHVSMLLILWTQNTQKITNISVKVKETHLCLSLKFLFLKVSCLSSQTIIMLDILQIFKSINLTDYELLMTDAQPIWRNSKALMLFSRSLLYSKIHQMSLPMLERNSSDGQVCTWTSWEPFKPSSDCRAF